MAHFHSDAAEAPARDRTGRAFGADGPDHDEIRRAVERLLAAAEVNDRSRADAVRPPAAAVRPVLSDTAAPRRPGPPSDRPATSFAAAQPRPRDATEPPRAAVREPPRAGDPSPARAPAADPRPAAGRDGTARADRPSPQPSGCEASRPDPAAADAALRAMLAALAAEIARQGRHAEASAARLETAVRMLGDAVAALSTEHRAAAGRPATAPALETPPAAPGDRARADRALPGITGPARNPRTGAPTLTLSTAVPAGARTPPLHAARRRPPVMPPSAVAAERAAAPPSAIDRATGREPTNTGPPPAGATAADAPPPRPADGGTSLADPAPATEAPRDARFRPGRRMVVSAFAAAGAFLAVSYAGIETASALRGRGATVVATAGDPPPFAMVEPAAVARAPDPQAALATAIALLAPGPARDPAGAAAFLAEAEASGLPQADFRLAVLYEHGDGVAADRGRALALYQRAAARGHVRAMHNAAVLLSDGSAGTQDYAAAARLFADAAAAGLVDSQFNLAVLYASGLGVPRDAAAAYRWFTLAGRAGDAEAARRSGEIGRLLGHAARRAADQAIAAWRPTPADPAANDEPSIGG